MTRTFRIAGLGLLAALTAGCVGQPAGLGPNPGIYGSARAHNNFQQVAYDTSIARLQDLGRQFAAEAPDTVTFAFDSAGLDATARAALDAQVGWLKAHPEVRMAVIGHTDLVGGERYNAGLGLRRARASVRYMLSRGIEADRLIAVESRGEADPVVATETRERRNRRTQTVVAGFRRILTGSGMDGVRALKVFREYQVGAEGVTEAASTDTGGS